jgi:hypothetical protein
MSKHIKLERGRVLLSAGYSLLVANENKAPAHSWKDLQLKAWTNEELEKAIQKPNLWRYGYCTGYNDVFVVDVDLKVLPIEKRADFFNEFMSFVRESIMGFDNRVAVYRTVNQGYHLTYRTKTDLGNLKLAVPIRSGLKKDNQDCNQALIETRGNGGYCVLYDDCVNNLDYTSIGYLDDEEHETLLSICKVYDERSVESERPEITKEQPSNDTSIKPWDDYNSRYDVFDASKDDFTIVRQLKDKVVVKRIGATSAHSGYVYRDSGCLYLFSTGTIYPSEKLLSAYAIYTYKNHNGDFSASAKQLYSDGYGDRIKRETPIKLSDPIEAVKTDEISFPIDVFPKDIQLFVAELNRTLGHSVDFMASGILWMTSLIIGNSMKVVVKRGWNECSVVWLALVGDPGVGKTPVINAIIKPLIDINSREIREYNRNNEKWQHYEGLTKEEKQHANEVQRPKKSQFIVNDTTIEALVELHEQNPNSVGIFKDELAGWIKDMNKYRAGSDLEFHLSAFSNNPAYTTRKTVKDNYIHSPVIPVLGGIQPKVMIKVFTDDFADNGFSDRLLLCFPEIKVTEFTLNEIDQDLLDWWKDYVQSLFSHVKNEIQLNEDGDVVSEYVLFSPDATDRLLEVMNELTEVQNSDETSETMKSIIPKQKTYIPRFSLLIHVLENYSSGEVLNAPIETETVDKAYRVSKYFIAMAHKVLGNSIEYQKLRDSLVQRETLSDAEKFAKMYAINPNLNKAETARMLKVTRQTVYNWCKELSK